MLRGAPKKWDISDSPERRVIDLINECGDREQNVIVKSDQEPVIKF